MTCTNLSHYSLDTVRKLKETIKKLNFQNTVLKRQLKKAESYMLTASEWDMKYYD